MRFISPYAIVLGKKSCKNKQPAQPPRRGPPLSPGPNAAASVASP